MLRTLLLILVVIVCTVAGQLFLKQGMGKVGRVGEQQMADLPRLLGTILTNPFVMFAIPLYAGSFLLWTVVLSRLPLSIAYPMIALNYVLIPLLARLIFKETISVQQWVGILLISTGVLLVITKAGFGE